MIAKKASQPPSPERGETDQEVVKRSSQGAPDVHPLGIARLIAMIQVYLKSGCEQNSIHRRADEPAAQDVSNAVQYAEQFKQRAKCCELPV